MWTTIYSCINSGYQYLADLNTAIMAQWRFLSKTKNSHIR